MPPLTSAYAKLARADKHLDALGAELDRWWKPHTQRRAVHIEREGAWHVVVVDPLPEAPPPRLSLVCGDFATNARAALDHAVADLVSERGKRPGRHTVFPIIWSEKDWCRIVVSPDKPRRSPLEGLDPQGEAWAIIREAQPYYGREPEGTPLAILNRLVNRDKHHAILIGMMFPNPDALDELVGWNDDAILLERIVPPTNPLALEERTELLRLRFSDEGPPPNVNVVGRLPVDPTFGDETHQATLGGLRRVHDYVAEVLAKLAAT